MLIFKPIFKPTLRLRRGEHSPSLGVAVTLSLLLSLAACGQKGPLYMPKQPVQASSTPLATDATPPSPQATASAPAATRP